jgi:antitoxin HigA-1
LIWRITTDGHDDNEYWHEAFPSERFYSHEVLENLGLTVSKAAEVLEVRRATLSDLVNGKAGVSPEMAMRIAKAFGVNMNTLLRMQTWFDTYTMRERADQIAAEPFVPVVHG